MLFTLIDLNVVCWW